MSVNQPLVTASAFQLSAALERYQMHIDALADPGSDRKRYELASRAFDEVRRLKGALPQLSVAMVEVLIAHVELLEALWRAGTGAARGIDLRGVRDRHARAVRTMHQQCLRFFVRS